MIYLVTYNLNDQDKKYDALYSALNSLGETHRDSGLDSVWFLSSGLSMNKIKDSLIAVIDQTDRVFITEIETGNYSGWMHQSTWDWLNRQT